MPRLSSTTRRVYAAGSTWRTCAACDELFPGAPDETRCPGCTAGTTEPARCEAAHRDDRSPCEGPPDAVRIVDAAGGQAFGCRRHVAKLLAALAGGRVYPAAAQGAAIEVYHRAAQLRASERGTGGGR